MVIGILGAVRIERTVLCWPGKAVIATVGSNRTEE
jgi:hypothetical protein